jgi:hypothetical protein
MNEQDESLMGYIISSLGENTTGPVLFDVNSTQFVKVNLVILKGLMQARNLNGLFISVDRPHQYMVHLMRMHNIALDRLLFLDAIGRFSADNKVCNAGASFVDAPFHIDTLPAAINSMGNDKFNLETCGFAMIDNPAAMLMYNSFASVEAVLKLFVDVMTSRGRTIIPLVVDKERCCNFYQTARSLSVKEIDCRAEVVADVTSKKGSTRNTEMRKISGSRFVDGGM